MKPGGGDIDLSPGCPSVTVVEDKHVNNTFNNNNCLLILNSLIKKGLNSWLKPVQKMISSTLHNCIKRRKNNCKNDCTAEDNKELLSTSDSSSESACVVNNTADNLCDSKENAGFVVYNSKLAACDNLIERLCDIDSTLFDVENKLNACITTSSNDKTATDNYDLILNDHHLLSLVEGLSLQEVEFLRKEIGYMQKVTNTFDVGCVPFVKVSIFDEMHKFCIDSGAAVSVLGKDMLSYIDPKQLKNILFQLNTANRSPVKVYGKLILPFSIGEFSFEHEFVFADVEKNFLGADFLRRFNIWLHVDRGIHIRDANRASTVEMELSSRREGELFLASINTSENVDDDFAHEVESVHTSNDASHCDNKISGPIVPKYDSSSSSEEEACDDYRNDFRTNRRTNSQHNAALNNIISNLDNSYADYHLHKRDIVCKESSNNEFCIDKDTAAETLTYLRTQYPSVFSGEISLQLKHDISMNIELNGDFKRPYIYTVPYCYKKAVRERIDELMVKGILRRSNSEFMNPITVVPKKDGTVRVCGDYRALNGITRSDCFTLPRIDYIKSHIRGKVFTTLDLKDGFFQVPMHKDSISKTAIYTEFGLFEFVRMPFGLKNAPAVFQRFIDRVFHDLRPFTHVYIDDVIIFSNTIAEHVKHLEAVIKRLAEYGLTVQERKCSFFLNKIHYLGFEFDMLGYRPLPRVMPQFASYPVPTDKKSVQKFLGAVNFYRSHIPDLADIAAPIYELLRKKSKFFWTSACQKSFEMLCKILSSRITLVPFNDDGDIILQTDASSVALGAVLMQDGKPVEFYSRKLTSVEQRYPTYEREAAAMVSAMLHFRPFLIGHTFELHTDHRPLLAWRNKMPESKRQARLWIKVQDLDFVIKYIPGEENILADFMSRPPGEEISSLSELHNDCTLNGLALSILTPELIKEAQQKDGFVQSCNLASISYLFLDERVINVNGLAQLRY